MTPEDPRSGTEAYVEECCQQWRDWGAQFGWKVHGFGDQFHRAEEVASFYTNAEECTGNIGVTLKAREDISAAIRAAVEEETEACAAYCHSCGEYAMADSIRARSKP